MNMIDQPLKQSREGNEHQPANHQDLNLVSQANESQEKLGHLPGIDASSSSSSASNDKKFEDNNSKSTNTYLPHLEIISNNSAAHAETTTLGARRSPEH